MKEATEELSSMVVVAILIGMLLAFFLTVIWPALHNNFESQASCDKAICGRKCDGSIATDVSDGMISCCYKRTDIKCPYKG